MTCYSAAEFNVLIRVLRPFTWCATLDNCPVMREHTLFPSQGIATAHIGNNSLHWLQSSSGDNHMQGIMDLFTICSNHQVCELCFWCMLKIEKCVEILLLCVRGTVYANV